MDLKAVATETRRVVVELAEKVGHQQYPAYYDQRKPVSAELSSKYRKQLSRGRRLPG